MIIVYNADLKIPVGDLAENQFFKYDDVIYLRTPRYRDVNQTKFITIINVKDGTQIEFSSTTLVKMIEAKIVVSDCDIINRYEGDNLNED